MKINYKFRNGTSSRMSFNYICLIALGFFMLPGSISADHPPDAMRKTSIKQVDVQFEVDRCFRTQDAMKHLQTDHKANGHSKDMKSDKSMNKMAHMDHTAKHGGTFFMASDKKHHLEGVYSEECGFQLYIYNEYTEPIKLAGFQAFIKITEESEGTEHILFLSLTKDHLVLQGPLIEGDHSALNFKGEFSIELYLKLPGRDIPELFNF